MSKLLLKVTSVVLLCMLSSRGSNAVTCNEAVGFMAQCVPYLKGASGANNPSPRCCQNVRTLNGAVRSRPDRRALCNCLRNRGSTVRRLRPERVSNLAGACGVNLAFRITVSINCANIP